MNIESSRRAIRRENKKAYNQEYYKKHKKKLKSNRKLNYELNKESSILHLTNDEKKFLSEELRKDFLEHAEMKKKYMGRATFSTAWLARPTKLKVKLDKRTNYMKALLIGLILADTIAIFILSVVIYLVIHQ